MVSARRRELKHLVDGGRRREETKVGAVPSRSGFQCRGAGDGTTKRERHAALWSTDAQGAAGFRTVIARLSTGCVREQA